MQNIFRKFPTWAALPNEAYAKGETQLAKKSFSTFIMHTALLLFFFPASNICQNFPVFCGIAAGTIILSNVLRVLISRKQTSYYSQGKRQTWLLAFSTLVWSSAIAWSAVISLSLYKYPLATFESNLSMLVALGICSAAVTSLGRRLYLAYGFFAIVSIPLIALLLYQGGNQGQTLAMITLCYLSFLVINVRQNNLDFYKRIEQLEETMEQKKVTQSLVDSIPGYISWLNEDLEYLGANKPLEDLLKNYDFDIRGKRVGSLYDNNSFVQKVLAFNESDSRRQSFEWSQLVKGKVEHLQTHLAKTDGGNNAPYLIVSTLDVTQLKEKERLIEQQRMQLINQSKLSAVGELAAGVAHEINNPLAIIRANTFKIRKDIENGIFDMKRAHESFENIDKTTKRIGQIIEGLSKISREGENNEFWMINPEKVIKDTVAFTQSHLESSGVQLFLNIPPTQNMPVFKGNPTLISQVLVNLLNNASDAISTMEEKWIRVSLAWDEESIQIVVTDSGRGIPKELHEKIMEPFFSTKDACRGTGVGLSISQAIAEKHGGRLRVNEASQNTQFILHIPREELVLLKNPSKIAA